MWLALAFQAVAESQHQWKGVYMHTYSIYASTHACTHKFIYVEEFNNLTI